MIDSMFVFIIEYTDSNNYCFSLQEYCEDELNLVSIVPKVSDVNPSGDGETDNVAAESSHGSEAFRITTDTKAVFLSTQYRMVFILDLSPSMQAVVMYLYQLL